VCVDSQAVGGARQQKFNRLERVAVCRGGLFAVGDASVVGNAAIELVNACVSRAPRCMDGTRRPESSDSSICALLDRAVPYYAFVSHTENPLSRA
jgi:hypothetical protein